MSNPRPDSLADAISVLARAKGSTAFKTANIASVGLGLARCPESPSSNAAVASMADDQNLT
jgi:hypothetical protein